MKYLNFTLILLILLGCSKRDLDVVMPTAPEDMPLQVILDSDEEGDFEDKDEAEIVFTLTERFDPDMESLGGKLFTLTQPALVKFEIYDFEGFDALEQYIVEAYAFHEIDDCNVNENLNFTLNMTTGEGSFTFPADVEEVVVVLVLNEELFDDDIINDSRGFKARSTELVTTEDAVINTDTEFQYVVLDDELIFGEYELDLDIEGNLNNLLDLFTAINEDIDGLTADEIDAIELEINLDDFQIKVVLVETESITECGETEDENIEIEIEGGLEELTDDDTSGDIEFVVELESEDGILEEFVYSGSFSIDGDLLTVELQSEDLEIGPITLTFKK